MLANWFHVPAKLASDDCSISTVPVVGAVPGYVVDHDTWRQSWKLIAVPVPVVAALRLRLPVPEPGENFADVPIRLL